MGAITGKIEFSGKFFAVQDPGQTIKDNIRDWLEDIAQELQEDVRSGLEQGEHGRDPVHAISEGARVSETVRGRVESLGGRKWQYHAVVSPDRTGLGAEQAIALYAAASEIEGDTHVVRNVTRQERRALRDLTAGLE